MNFIKIFVFSFIFYFFSWVLVDTLGINKLAVQSEDTIPAMFIPVTILKEGTIYTDTYYNMIIQRYPHPDDKDYKLGLTPFYLKKINPTADPTVCVEFGSQVKSSDFDRLCNTHYISAFPIISGLIAILVYILPVGLGMVITFENLAFLSHMAAALVMSLSGGVMYLLLNNYIIKDSRKSLLVTFIYLFSSVNFALISQALWQHGPVQLFLLLAIYMFAGIIFEKQEKLDLKKTFLGGLFMGISVLSRPTAGLPVIVLSVFLVYLILKSYSKKSLLQFLLLVVAGLTLCFLFFVWYNKTYYISIENQGYFNQLGRSWLSKFPEGFLGMWISPSKGILTYSPVFLFSLLGAFIVFKRKNYKEDSLYIASIIIILLHTLIVGRWKHWYGGWSFGYRMSSDILPFLTLLLVPYIKSDFFNKTKNIFVVLISISVLVQIMGIVFFDGVWHAAYDKGFDETSWLWSIKDSEMVFNIRRILVKVGLLEKACDICL